jgi:hypothetical protein
MIKYITAGFFIFFAFEIAAQEMRADSTWWDNNLQFKVMRDQMRSRSELEICIYHTTRGACIENLVTGFEVRIYDAAGKELWNSLWTGKNKNIKFKKKFPTASYVVIKATRPFVINELSTNRIYQDKPLELKYKLQ